MWVLDVAESCVTAVDDCSCASEEEVTSKYVTYQNIYRYNMLKPVTEPSAY